MLERFTGSYHRILPISSLRISREQHGFRFLKSCAFVLIRRETSDRTSYQIVGLVFRHFAAASIRVFSLSLPCPGIFHGFSACQHICSYSNHAQNNGRLQMHVCMCVHVRVWKTTVRNTKKKHQKRWEICQNTDSFFGTVLSSTDPKNGPKTDIFPNALFLHSPLDLPTFSDLRSYPKHALKRFFWPPDPNPKVLIMRWKRS